MKSIGIQPYKFTCEILSLEDMIDLLSNEAVYKEKIAEAIEVIEEEEAEAN